MTETERPTYEQASRCPRCDMPGKKINEVPAGRPGVKIHVFNCETRGCIFEGTSFFVQVNPDGTVPEVRHTLEDKLFPIDRSARPSTEREQKERAIIDRLRREHERTTKPGAEIRNPRG
jgi:hypothetical protein